MKFVLCLLLLSNLIFTTHAFIPSWVEAFFLPSCPKYLPSPECSCQIDKARHHGTTIRCMPTEEMDINYMLNIIADHGGLIDELYFHDCARNVGELMPLPLLKVVDV